MHENEAANSLLIIFMFLIIKLNVRQTSFQKLQQQQNLHTWPNVLNSFDLSLKKFPKI